MSFKDPAQLPDPDLAMRWNWSSAYPAPAKLNLFLHVTGRRPDGYHTLQTLFRFVALQDTLHFMPRSDGQIVLANPIPGVAPESDLTVRAAHALRQAAGIRDGVTIQLDKQLPMMCQFLCSATALLPREWVRPSPRWICRPPGI